MVRWVKWPTVAQHVPVGLQTMKRWAKRGLIKPPRKISNVLFWDLDSINEFFNSEKGPSAVIAATEEDE